MAEDWHDSLRALLNTSDIADEIPTSDNVEATTAPAHQKQSGVLDIIVERKGRSGKVATIISGFTVDDETVDDIAAQLKRKLGTGGSARGGEILIQGDRARAIKDALTTLGLKSRII